MYTVLPPQCAAFWMYVELNKSPPVRLFPANVRLWIVNDIPKLSIGESISMDIPDPFFPTLSRQIHCWMMNMIRSFLPRIFS